MPADSKKKLWSIGLVHVSLQHFYEQAPRCPDLEKGERWHQTWLCKRTGGMCSPKTCPKAGLQDLFLQEDTANQAGFEPAAPEPTAFGSPSRLEKKRHQKGKPAQARPHVTIDRSKPKMKRRQKPRSQVIDLPNAKIIRKKTVRNYSRPNTKADTKVLRALITFQPKEGSPGMLNRWAVDCIFSKQRSRPTVMEFVAAEKNCTNARFYFPSQGYSGEQVRALIGSWFGNQKLHSEESKLNVMGAPVCFSIDFVED